MNPLRHGAVWFLHRVDRGECGVLSFLSVLTRASAFSS
jgi:hypothetical protein